MRDEGWGMNDEGGRAMCVCDVKKVGRCLAYAQGWWCRCDPKGAGVLTTRKRYSRKAHRQTETFLNPRGTYHPKK